MVVVHVHYGCQHLKSKTQKNTEKIREKKNVHLWISGCDLLYINFCTPHEIGIPQYQTQPLEFLDFEAISNFVASWYLNF